MLRRSSFSLIIWLLLAVSLFAGTASAVQADSTDEDEQEDEQVEPEIGTYGDAELIETLVEFDLLDEWISSSPVAPQVSLLEVSAGSNYAAARQGFLDSIHSWAQRNEEFRSDLDRIEATEAAVAELRSITTQVREALVLDDRRAATSQTELDIKDAIARLAKVVVPVHELEFSLDPATLAEQHLATVRNSIEAEVVPLTDVVPGPGAKSTGGTIAAVTDLHFELKNVDRLTDRARDDLAPAIARSERFAESLRTEMSNLHAARMLAASEIEGIALVAVDAYVRAGARLDASCPVDWTLLAGIGRVESRHGTIGGSSVQWSGRVTTNIYGPLLDGGATERAAEDAIERAEQEAAAAAEAEAEAIRVAEEEAYENSVWGQLRREALAKEARQRGQDPDADAPASDLPEDYDGPTTATHDPAIWRNLPDPPASDTDESGGDDDEEPDEEPDETEEELEFKGNGFAVIADSDGGLLDENDEWDRAVGPMQFIPETWSYWATDGNGDGVSDPQNLYDAAAAAGRFLCHLSSTRGSSPSTFVLGYNSSDAYVRNVLSRAAGLRGATLPDVQGLLAS